MPSTEALSEKQFQALVLELAQTFGWRHYHTHNSRRSPHGFPDLVLVRDRVIFAELKSDAGKLSDAQASWIETLMLALAEIHVWRPADLPEIAQILARRAERVAIDGESVRVLHGS